VALCLLAACSATPRATVTLVQGSRSLHVRVELARTEPERTRGLMDRVRVPPGTGMLFVYPDLRAWGGYWMKDTLVPLDIAFIARGRISEIDTMTPCRADPCPQTSPADPYDQALEVPAGTFERAGITAGAEVRVG
jgi:uncharacterized membrane protein (UPF0127 family)